MRGPKLAALELKQREREELEALVRKHSTPKPLAQRGRMILLAAEGKGNAQIARELGACADTVRSWRMRWLGWQKLELSDFSVSERLSDTPRPGRPPQITAEQFCQLIAFACEPLSLRLFWDEICPGIDLIHVSEQKKRLWDIFGVPARCQQTSRFFTSSLPSIADVEIAEQMRLQYHKITISIKVRRFIRKRPYFSRKRGSGVRKQHEEAQTKLHYSLLF